MDFAERERERFLVAEPVGEKNFTCQSAKIRLRWLEGIACVRFSGIVTNSVMAAVGPLLVKSVGKAVAITCFNGAIVSFPDESTIDKGVSHYQTPGVWIVSAAQHDQALIHARMLAKYAIYRSVYSRVELQDALEWARVSSLQQKLLSQFG